MTPDIVERLHEAIAHIVCEDGCNIDKVMAEAADEIERLMATVVRLDRSLVNQRAEIEQLRILTREFDERNRSQQNEIATGERG